MLGEFAARNGIGLRESPTGFFHERIQRGMVEKRAFEPSMQPPAVARQGIGEAVTLHLFQLKKSDQREQELLIALGGLTAPLLESGAVLFCVVLGELLGP